MIFFNFKDPESCIPCFENAICKGGDKVVIMKDFWRENKKSNKLEQCFDKLCIGGSSD